MDKLGPDDPHRIGAYRLLARLGEGGMGQVFLARSERGRTVALKLVRRELAEQPEFRARFRQEVRAAHQVGGAWTAPVLDSDTEAPVPWVATGYVAGPSLHRIVSGRPGAPLTDAGAYGPLPTRSVQLLGSGLAHALQHIHRAGLIHRDLKPSNVLLTIDGPRVIDFGIARALESLADGDLTRTGAMIGSPGFMAPEQVRGERVTTACDVFCLGSVLAYAATGRLPFGAAESGGAHALMFRIAQEDPDLAGVPAELAGVVRDCLAKDPAARPTTDEILARLGEAEADEPWLPATLIAQLGRQAVGLLDAEDPEAPAAPADPQRPQHPHTPPAPVHALPTQAAPPPPTPTPPPYTHQPQPQPYTQPHHHQGYHPTPGPTYNSPLPPAYFTPAPSPAPTPARRSAGATVALVAVAIVVAIGAGGSVYAFMNTKGGDTPTPGPSTSASGHTAGTGADGGVPDGYLGTWSASLPGDRGASTRKLTIRQGDVGDQVLSLTAEGPLALGATYHCEFTAPLAVRPADGEPVRIGPSTVSVGRPSASCSPGKATELTLLPDGTLRRTTTASGESLIYTRSD
ncbi:serine/threonine-protein kinase [Streptomyces cyaneofuscatus]|uniref:Serine/threonine protein kinase n=1 Tax=Streptomyces cyaneofuscatus TaxID=66883 RepID=A0ABZ1EWX3_9ACTN|nr:serine/threonine-protein kinase [Streptomyces cyaneofuscatus]WSB08636.1 serine/threonine protein kinase [Streptomyces cyaneofuscatus]WSD47830.1 serine/threonine protein kinase [Streptomyces cyaneofuscatus]